MTRVGVLVRRALLAAAILVAGNIIWGIGERLGEPRPGGHSIAENTHLEGPVRQAAALLRARPVRLTIPAIALTTSLDQVGMKADSTVQDPVSVDRPSWFSPGPAPGEIGSAVVLGHVDSTRGPAVFYRLSDLRPADLVMITTDTGASATFTVTDTQVVDKNAFPATEVYGSHGTSQLKLVTCTGAFDQQRRSYRSNLIVTAELVSTAQPGAE